MDRVQNYLTLFPNHLAYCSDLENGVSLRFTHIVGRNKLLEKSDRLWKFSIVVSESQVYVQERDPFYTMVLKQNTTLEDVCLQGS